MKYNIICQNCSVLILHNLCSKFVIWVCISWLALLLILQWQTNNSFNSKNLEANLGTTNSKLHLGINFCLKYHNWKCKLSTSSNKYPPDFSLVLGIDWVRRAKRGVGGRLCGCGECQHITLFRDKSRILRRRRCCPMGVEAWRGFLEGGSFLSSWLERSAYIWFTD